MADLFSTRPSFCSSELSFALCLFGSYFAVYSVVKQTATARSTMAVKSHILPTMINFLKFLFRFFYAVFHILFRLFLTMIDKRVNRNSSEIHSTINMFILSKPEKKIDDENTIRIVLPFKDQIAVNAVRRQLRDLSRKICVTLQPIFVSKKLEQDLKPKEIKPSIVNRQCVVYKFACDLCDADYVGYTARHLHQRIAEHKYSSIGKHLLEAHGDKNLLNEGQFYVLKKCHGKFDCLVYEMLFIQELKPSLNTQSDSISAKLFV